MVFLKSLYHIAWSARTKPVRSNLLIVQCLYQAERIEDVLRVLAEMIAVIISAQLFQTLLVCHTKRLAKRLNIPTHRRGQLCKADATDGRILVVHADVVKVVQFAEDAELRELGYASDKDKLQIRIEQFHGTIEVLHHLAKRL